jgi:hypothetical protein
MVDGLVGKGMQTQRFHDAEKRECVQEPLKRDKMLYEETRWLHLGKRKVHLQSLEGCRNRKKITPCTPMADIDVENELLFDLY